MLEFVAGTLSFVAVASTVFKHRSFAEENEWRVISRALGTDKAPVKFRASENMVIPYTTFELSRGNDGLGIARIVCGPTAYQEETFHTLEMFCREKALDKVKVERSACPYRSW